MINCKVSSSTLQSNESVVAAGDNESKNYSTFDVVLSQFERFHVDSQQAKHSTCKKENCSELDTTVEDLAVSISSMDFAKKETLEIRAFKTLKSDSYALHKLHDEKCSTSPHEHRRRATVGQHRNHRHWSRFCSIKNVRIYFSQLKINESAALSDDSSVIFVSDMSVSDVESVNLDDGDVILNEDDKESVDNEMQVVTETVTTTEIITKTEETILKVDKSTQTYENEFHVQSVASPGILALPSTTSTPKKKINVLSVSAVNCLNISAARDPTLSQKSTSNIQSTIVPYVSLVNIRKNTAIDSINKLNATNNNENTDKNGFASTSGKSNNLNTVDKKKNNDKKDMATTSNKSKNSNAVNDKENRGKHDTAYNSKDDKNSQGSVRRTWTKSRSYQNHRVQPYQRYNNYYSGRQNDYDRYGGRRNDYNDYNSYGYRGRYRSEYQNNNRYNSNSYGYGAPYNSYNPQRGWQVQHYTYQFKERLFTGFVRFMDFVFQYDYTGRN
ncbi:hypothetical protein TSAR_009170 [Trichomalopsis sarcophagae]|uniref:Uncharacterized protein n=1 Tax=Trichomalopsis sarcophagae TaxID=543379 RepID=A0A232F1B2_9HYME|nr:hypothetical protein TSAR_009170 [Trichomalopsis sarcophagae]